MRFAVFFLETEDFVDTRFLVRVVIYLFLLVFLLLVFYEDFLELFPVAELFFFPRPDPLFLPPPDSLFTVAHARDSASFFETPFVS